MTDQMDIKRQIASLTNEAIGSLQEAEEISKQVALKNALASALVGEIQDLQKKLEA